MFRALEQPEESSQKNRIANDKEEFLNVHNCVSPQELEALIKVRELLGEKLRKWLCGLPGGEHWFAVMSGDICRQ